MRLTAKTPKGSDSTAEPTAPKSQRKPKASAVTVRCLVCGKTFKTASGLRNRHLPTHKPQELRLAVQRRQAGQRLPWEPEAEVNLSPEVAAVGTKPGAPSKTAKKATRQPKKAAAPKKTTKRQPKAAKVDGKPKASDFVDFKATEWPGAAGPEVPEELRSEVNKLQWKVVNDNLRPARAAKAAKTRSKRQAKAAPKVQKKAASPKQPKAAPKADDAERVARIVAAVLAALDA